MTAANPTLEAALQYARRGWSVIAVHSIRAGRCTCGNADCASPGKHPIGPWKHRQKSRATEAKMVEQWQRTPWANVGIVTGAVSGMIVLDVDDITKLDQAQDLLAAVQSISTPVAITGREGVGLHIYLRHPGGTLGNFAKHIEGMDGRGDGGFVVAPPSTHASGKQYRWASEAYDGTNVLAEAPEAVLRLFGRGAGLRLPSASVDAPTAYGRAALADEAAQVRSTAEGGRNDRLNRAAFSTGQLVASGDVPFSTAKAELVAAGIAAGLPVNEVEDTVRSGMEGGASKPRSSVASDRNALVAANDTGNPLPLEYFGDIEPALTNDWLVRGLFPQNGLVLIYGAPGSGKSFLAADISLRIAADMDVDGRAVQQCPTVYIAAEGQTGFRKRVKAFRRHHAAPDDVPFALIPSSVDLFDAKADLPRLYSAIDAATARFDAPPGMIVVDTLAATFGSGDENSKDMVAYVNNLAKLRDGYRATVCAVHHRPKDHTNSTPRGHGSLAGAMDTILLVEDGAVRTAKVTKQKDAEAGPPITFAVKSVLLGRDEDDEPVDGGVVTYLLSQVGGKLTKQVQAILAVLTDLLDTDDAEADPAGTKWVAEGAWRQAWIAGGAAEKPETRRKAFDRGKTVLTRRGAVTLSAGKVALAPDAPASYAATAGAIMDFSVGTRPYDMSDPERAT